MSSILGTIAALIISLIAVSGFTSWAKMGGTNIINAAVAGQAVTFNGAVQRYVQDNGPAIATVATPTSPYTITPAMLATYLPSGFSAGNPWKQQWQAQVLQPSAGQLETLVTTTGGIPIDDPKQLIQIAAQVGAQGGYIPYAGMLGNASYDPSTAIGTLGAWSRQMTGFSNPGAGHLASLLSFSGIQTSNGYLYRIAVPGQPQLNAMQTNLSMTDASGAAHDINGIRVANAQTVAATGAVTAGTFATNNNAFRVDAGGRVGSAGYAPDDLPGGWGGGVSTFDVYSHGTMAAGAGGNIAASMNSAGAIRGASGRFNVESNGVVSLSTVGASGNGCAIQNGQSAVTTDSAGVPLACVNGVWTPIGGKQQKAGFFTAVDGNLIPAPNCPSTAIPQIIVTVANIYIDTTASASYGASGGGPWVVYIRNGTNSPIPGAVAQVETFCAFN